MTAVLEKLFGVRLLKIRRTKLSTGNLRRNRQDRNAAAMTIEETVDEMQVTGTTASGADREPIRQMRFRASSKSRRFLVPHVDPLDLFMFADGIRESIERISRQAVDTLHIA